MRKAHCLLGLLATMGLWACSAPPERVPGPATVRVDASAARPPTQLAPLPPATTARWRIAPTESSVRILVYRGGTMARLGHNHVISAADLRGYVWRAPTLEDSGFEIAVPVNTLVVDDNSARAEEGEDFPLNVSEDAKAATKANMLRPTLLDGQQFPEITIRATHISGNAATPEVVARLRIKDQTREVRLPVTLTEAGSGLVVQGSFEIRQSDFGITPLSIAMGALTVQDAVKIKFRLVATPHTHSP